MQHTHTGKHRKTQSSACFCTVQPAGCRTCFARKHRKNRCENKTKVQFRVSKVLKLEFQHMPAKKSHHPARWQTHMLPTTTTTAATTFPCRVSAAESRKTPERHEAPANRQWGRWKADRAEPSDVLPSLLFPKIGIIPRALWCDLVSFSSRADPRTQAIP